MKSKIKFNLSTVFLTFIFFVTGCGLFKGNNQTNTITNSAENNAVNLTANNNSVSPQKKGVVSPDDKAEFTSTAEDLFKETKAEKNPIKKGEKYVDKIIAVSGRIKDMDLTKKNAEGYQVLLSVGETFAWLECRVDEENKEDFAQLKKDEQVTLKGLGNKYWLVGPRLKHCVVIKDN